MPHKSGLGKGLDALIPNRDQSPPPAGVMEIPINRIVPNPHQPRATIQEEALDELAASIREHGILQPLVVRHEPATGDYILIAGERRWRAAQKAKLATLPVIVREATPQQQLEWALIENLQRADLNPLEMAEAYRHLTDDFGLSQETVADRVGKSRVSVTNTLRLLKLPKTIQAALVEGKISEGHARALLSLNTTQAQLAALQTIIKSELNVRETEELVRKLNGERVGTQPEKAEPSPMVLELEERLRVQLGTRVNLHHGPKGGSLVIHYYSDEELDGIIAQILHE
jgi:ParB family chromosome partitioning protein